jgi:hypothetical protein
MGKRRFPHKSAVKNRDDRTVERHVVSLIKKSALQKAVLSYKDRRARILIVARNSFHK